MKYFKTDGIRMNANELIFSLIPLKLGRILGNVSKKICIGFDTRISSSEFMIY
jgi:phosphomannomutase